MNARKAMTLTFFLALLSIGYISMYSAPALSDEDYSYHGDTEWRTNFTAAQDVAADQDRPMIVYFWTTWCTYCEDYNREVYSDPSVQAELDDFVKVAVNLDSDAPAASRLQRRYDVNYPPQHVVVTPEGDVLVQITGYAPTSDFLAYLAEGKRAYAAGETR